MNWTFHKRLSNYSYAGTLGWICYIVTRKFWFFWLVETWDNLVFYCAAQFTSKHCVSANHRNKPFITILLGSLARIYQNFSFWLENMYSTKRMGKFAELPPSFHTFRKVKLHLLNSRNLQLCWKLWFSSKSFLPR